jgi:predicted MFS family arabinose efflux permease
LHGGAHTLGFLMGASGVGAFSSALYLAARRSVLGLGKLDVIAAGTFGAALVAFSFSTHIWLSMLLLFFVGGSMMIQMAASNTILQTIVDDDKRGRIMSLFTMAFFGTVPFGSLIAGALADRIGAMPTIAAGGIVCMLGAAWMGINLNKLRDLVRPIYRRIGILPEIAGLNNASELARAENK